ncbi:MAG: hypothetical protein CVT94_13410 [Bacteroidetes bacterium HGW-Bacteroidetes-11]|jgi:hypothetical protein|nr:MAG: hypothetical protein CVT94_13410 [Bacteroidetes bacterium HGW-Bacteroidetes-11]
MKLYIIALLLIFTGCVSERRCNSKFPPATASSDSTNSTANTYDSDSTFFTKRAGDSSWIKLYIECNEHGQALIRQVEGYKAGQKVGIPTVTITGNTLTAKCEVDSLEVYNRIKKAFKTEITYRDRKVKETKYINQLTTSQRRQITGFWIISSLLIIILSLYIKRQFFS